MKKVVMVLMAVLMFTSASFSAAAPDGATKDVKLRYVYTNSYGTILCTLDGYDHEWLKLGDASDASGRAMLVTALAAKAGGFLVKIEIKPKSTPTSRREVGFLYIM